MYRALITDLDGTAVRVSSNGNDIGQETIHAIARAQESGFYIASATGRDWDIAKPVIKALGIESPCIISGGSSIINPINEEIIWEKSLDSGTSVQIFSIFRRLATHGFLMTSLNQAGTPFTEVESVEDNVNYMYLIGVDEDTGLEVEQAINWGMLAVAHSTPSWVGAGFVDVHVTHPKATKEYALLAWHKLMGVTVEETIGMGDSDNDPPLFLASGLKIAVGNASERLKLLADYTAPPIEDQPIVHVIDKFLFNEQRIID